MNAKQWISGARPQTLLLGFASVTAGIGICSRMHALNGLSVRDGNSRNWTAREITVAALCMIVALFLQIAANFADDYSDGVRGIDEGRGFEKESEKDSEKGLGKADRPSSKAPRRLVASGVSAKSVLHCALFSAAVACAAGLSVVAITKNYLFLAAGALCLAAAWFYAGGRKPYSAMGLGELSAFLFFGPTAVAGTVCAVEGTLFAGGRINAIFESFAIGFYSASLMLVNNIRDIESDEKHGKYTLPVRIGYRASVSLFTVLILAAPSLLLFGSYSSRAGEICSDSSAGQSGLPLVFIVMSALTAVLTAADIFAIAKKHYKPALPITSFLSLWSALCIFFI